jgi:hypothetical protein
MGGRHILEHLFYTVKKEIVRISRRMGSERISFYRQKAQALYAKLEKLGRGLLNYPKAS